MPHHVLALLNQPSRDAAPHDPAAPAFTFTEPSAPQLGVLDLGVSRGDGIFETISVASGQPQALEHHLRRFVHSAALLDLPAPDVDVWREAIRAAAAELGAVPESWIKTVLTRGIEGDGRPSGWVYSTASGDFSAARTLGVRVVTLDRGYRHDVERTSPWLLAGAKTLSYAVNRAALREAERRGADDVIFVSSDGYVLEGPTSTVLYRRGDSLLTPGTGLGILDGTTQSNAFRLAETLGMQTGFERLTVAELIAADALWLVSSVRLAAPVCEVDGAAFPVDAEFTVALNRHLLSLRE